MEGLKNRKVIAEFWLHKMLTHLVCKKFDKTTVIKYFKGLSMYVERAYDKLDAKDTYIINQLDNVKELIYSTIYKLENLQ